MPIYPGRRGGTWRVTVYSRGKQNEWIVEGTKRDARRFEEDRRLELRTRSVTSGRAELKFGDFSRERYNPHAALHLGASTWEHVRQYQVADLIVHMGEARLSEVGDQVEAYKQTCAELGRSARTTNHYLAVLRAMLRLAKKWKLLDVVPEIQMLPRQAQERPHFWTLDEVRRAYRAAQMEAPEFLPLLHFLLETGCRRGEAVHAEWSWVDWDAAMLRIPVTRYWHPKGKRARDVPLTPELLETLRSMPGPREGRIFRQTRGQIGQPYAQWPRKLWDVVMAAADLEDSTPHCTRHTYASHFLASVPDLGVLAEVMGHTQTRVTELYAHMLPERLARARGAVRLAPAGTLAPTLANRASARNR